MANNRMILVCNVCVPIGTDWEYHQKGILVLAKWYPGGVDEEGAAYFSYRDDKTFGEEFMQFLEEHKHGEARSEYYLKGAGQENPVRIEYESVGLPILQEKKEEK